jgi:hypothetical protein
MRLAALFGLVTLCLVRGESARGGEGVEALLQDCIAPIIARHRAADGSPFNALSLSEAPEGLLLELAAGDWGGGLGPSITLHVDCRTGAAVELDIAGVTEISDPWYDPASGRLYFASRVPQSDGGSNRDLFVSQVSPAGWLAAERLPESVNSEHDEYSPVVRGDALYFASARRGSGDLYRANLADPSSQPQVLPAAVNSVHGEWNLWVSEDERSLVFESSGRVSNLSVPGDLYLAQRDASGRWRPAVALTRLNSKGSDLNPRQVGDSLVWARSDSGTRRTRLVQAPLAGFSNLAEQPWAGRLVYAARSSHEVGVLSLADGGTMQSFGLEQGPHLLAASPEGRYVAAAAYGVFPRPHAEPVTSNPGWVEGQGGQVLLWDTVTGAARYVDSGCRRPHGATWENERVAWFSCEDRQSVIRLEWRGFSEPATVSAISTGQSGAHVLAWDAPRGQVLATHTEAGGIWFGGTGHFLPLGPGSEALQLMADGLHALVGVGPKGEVVKINLQTQKEVARWSTGCGFPISFTRDAWQRVWLACLSGRELQRLDPDSGDVQQRLRLPEGPLHVVAHPSLPVLYASTPRRNEILELPMEGLADESVVSRRFSAGMEPDGIVLLGDVSP